ncbi:MAG: threonine synthase [Acidobacteriota bacterium]|nr:threonine synthase [Acidobacteriota bacterium]
MNPFVTHLECSACEKILPPRQLINLCPCGSPLLVRYDLSAVRAKLSRKVLGSRPHTMWRYRELLPPGNSHARISLGEGGTPLVDAERLASSLGLSRLWIKDEGTNPTGSFKARGLSAAVTMAKALGAENLAIPSAGNAGGALAAYAAQAGLQAHVFMPRDVPPANRIECETLGAHIHLVDGLITDCGRLVARESKDNGWFDVATLKEPYRIEGKKTLGLELAEQLRWRLPDVIIYPTGGGTGLVGMWKAFNEMRQLGWIDSKQPKMVSVQAVGCAPVVRAFEQGHSRCEPWSSAATLAAGLRVPRAIGDFLILEILRQSGGTAVAVTDEEMLADARAMGRSEGLFVCPEGGATLAALKKLIRSGFVRPSDEVVLFNTGSGLKYLHLFEA